MTNKTYGCVIALGQGAYKRFECLDRDHALSIAALVPKAQAVEFFQAPVTLVDENLGTYASTRLEWRAL